MTLTNEEANEDEMSVDIKIQLKKKRLDEFYRTSQVRSDPSTHTIVNLEHVGGDDYIDVDTDE